MTSELDREEAQRRLCEEYGVPWCPSPPDLNVGVSKDLRSEGGPINGLRHPPEGDTTGWYLWTGAGDPPSDPDFFVPLHVAHLSSWRPEVLKFLGLPPGWRFLTDVKGYEDVWHDPSLLEM